MKIGLFFGSFNPIHVGHLIIGNHMAEHGGLDRVWFVVSPQNPLKEKKSLARDRDRLHLVKLAVAENPKFRASDIEFSLPKPSFTVDTLAFLAEKHPEHDFALIMGGDNLATLHLWKNYEKLLAEHDLLVYKRPGHDLAAFEKSPRVRLFEAPLMDISATFIREQIRLGKSIQYLVPDEVFEYLKGSRMYQI